MKHHSNSILFGGALALIAVLASSASAWLPKLLAFLGANSSLIQALADLIQILLWVIAALLILKKLYLKASQKSYSSLQNEDIEQKRYNRSAQTAPKNSTSYSINAEKITGLVQGENNRVINFNDSSSKRED